MAVHGMEETLSQGSQPKVDINVEQGNGINQPSQTGSFVSQNPLGFIDNNLYLPTNNMGSAYTNGVCDIMRKTFEAELQNNGVRLDIVDRETHRQIAYSAIVASKIVENKVAYFTIILSATGNKALTATELISEYQSIYRAPVYGQPKQEPNIFTYDQVVDDIYEKVITDYLTVVYRDKSISGFIGLDGVVLPYAENVELAAKSAVVSAISAIKVDELFVTKKKSDLNLRYAIANSGNSQLRTSKMFGKSKLSSTLGTPIRRDWTISLDLQDNSRKIQSLNAGSNVRTLTRVSGFVDTIPEVVSQPGANGQTMSATRLHPHIIITNTELAEPTPAFLLLGILTASPMVNKSMWAATFLAKLDDLGALEKVVNLAGNPTGVGTALKLRDKKFTEIDIKNFISSAISLSPIISFDVESYGINSYYTSVLAAAASPNPDVRVRAAHALIKVANNLTNGAFPINYDPNMVFTNNGVSIPLGVWASKEGEHDVREIDLAFIAKSTDDTQSMNKWVISNLPKEVTNIDPFQAKIESIASLVPDAEITGKATRVTFKAEFITTLVQAAQACGLQFTYEPEVNFDASTVNWASINNTLATGAINPGAMGNIAREYIGQGATSSYFIPYTQMGAYRG